MLAGSAGWVFRYETNCLRARDSCARVRRPVDGTVYRSEVPATDSWSPSRAASWADTMPWGDVEVRSDVSRGQRDRRGNTVGNGTKVGKLAAECPKL